ncbi:unnamed protein product [Allacma fusca]|uniref:Uncharacterized protein n=1 Tax=Allacma fusca TaxID=39272 RepID=A0A8J2PVY2_9HEXA|nr:unnamed protein product [Allacma fusca]
MDEIKIINVQKEGYIPENNLYSAVPSGVPQRCLRLLGWQYLPNKWGRSVWIYRIKTTICYESWVRRSWNNLTGQNLGNFPTQLHASKTTPTFQQQNHQPPAPNLNHVNLVKQCMNVPYWNGDNENGYNRGPITPLQPTDPEAFHQYFQQNQQSQQSQLNPSKGVYVKVGAREEKPVVFANGGYPENEGQGDVQGAGRRNLG